MITRIIVPSCNVPRDTDRTGDVVIVLRRLLLWLVAKGGGLDGQGKKGGGLDKNVIMVRRLF
jgi:hypothetical protein